MKTERILLVDFYNLFIRNFMIVPITNDDGDHFGGVFGFLRSLKIAIDKLMPTAVYIVYDGPNAALRRKMIDENYKSCRKKEWKRGIVKAYDFLNEQEQTTNFSMQISKLNEYLSILPVKTISIPYIEADDVIAEIANSVNELTEVIIYSTDSDYKQLIRKNVVCYNPMLKKLFSEKTFFEKMGFLAKNYIYFKSIDGDKSDSLVGINGIGLKTFLKLYPFIKDTEIKSLDELFEYSKHVIESQSKIHSKAMKTKHSKILESESIIRKNYQLMQLLDVNISLQSKTICRELINEHPNIFNRLKLRKMFIDDKLNTQIKYFNDWTRVFSKLVIR